MTQETSFILAVALITWGGVFFYLLRLNFLTRDIEKKISERDEVLRDDATPNTQVIHSESTP